VNQRQLTVKLKRTTAGTLLQGAQHLQTVELHVISALDDAIACRILSGVVRLSTITLTSPSSKAHQKSGPFAPPALAAPADALDLAARNLKKEYRLHAAGMCSSCRCQDSESSSDIPERRKITGQRGQLPRHHGRPRFVGCHRIARAGLARAHYIKACEPATLPDWHRSGDGNTLRCSGACGA
jgi:hypothetical protein